MTSFIFGAVVLGHGAIVNHKREKTRLKNYQRWEGLRDEYDLQKKTQRESRSLDIQRTGMEGSGYYTPELAQQSSHDDDDDHPGIFTLRDQQDHNDARLGWRPQEVWEKSEPDSRRHSIQLQPTGKGHFQGEFKPQKTGATWDAGLPPPLRVTRRNWDDGNGSNTASPRVGSPAPDRSMSRASNRDSVDIPRGRESMDYARPRASMDYARPRASLDYTRSSVDIPRGSLDLSRNASNASSYRETPVSHQQSAPPRISEVQPIMSHVPGGRMAELIELGQTQSAPERASPHYNYNSGLPQVQQNTVGDWWERP